MISLHAPPSQRRVRALPLLRRPVGLLLAPVVLLALLAAPSAWAELPPPSAEAKAAAEQAAARRSQEQQRNAYLLCLRQDEIADAYGIHATTRPPDARAADPSVPPCKPPGEQAAASARSSR